MWNPNSKKRIILFDGCINMDFRLKIVTRGFLRFSISRIIWIGKALVCLWKSKVSRKILIFGWRLILNKLATRMELTKCGIIDGVNNVACPFYFLEEEDVEHLFCSSFFSNIFWINFCLWIGVDVYSLVDSLLDRLLDLNLTSSFLLF